MPALASHSTSDFAKLLFIGNSGSGKTGALTSLVAAGYRLRILDLDNGLDALVNHVRAECPGKIGNVEYETVRDKIKATTAGPKVDGAKAFVRSAQLMDKWTDQTIPAEWGSETIFVLDSLTALGKAAYAWAMAVNPATKEKRQWYQEAQNAVEDIIALLTAESFHANVIVISHIDYREDAGLTRGFVSSIGAALGPKLPRYFNTLVLAESVGQGKAVRRRIKTLPTAMIDLKNPAPMKIEAEYPLETGLATLFKQLKGK
jgi:hypothetical protein